MNLILLSRIMYLIQLLHSAEELANNFHKRWFFIKMSFNHFLVFELIHNIIWAIIIFIPSFPLRLPLIALFSLLMFANGIEHCVWWMWEKKYVPGLYTGLMHIIVFIVFFYSSTLGFGL